MSAIKRIGVVASAVVVLGLPVGAQQPSVAPDLTRAQRTALQAVVTAVDAAATSADSEGVQWPLHVLRASDGSHYVAFSLVAPPGLVAHRPLVLYVRLATRQEQSVTAGAERSAVAEWLAGQRSTPLRAERGIAFGEMPTYGAAALGNRTQTNVSQGLALLEMERDRARERREERERERKAALEGEGARAARPLLPFEDFDVNTTATPSAGGTAVIMRSLTAGPGRYVLTVGWTDPAAKDPVAATKVFRRSLNLPIASTTEFGLSSVIVADAISVRETPLRADEQSRQPYSIGTTNIVPAQDAVLTMDEHLTLVVQVINPRPAANGKPDVVVGFRLQRTTAAGHEEVGILNPLVYNQDTLPPDFDVAKGHPIFAAVEVPLRTFKRGLYRLQIGADDRLVGVSAATETSFTIIGTPAALLRDAPPLAPPFRRESLLTAPVVEAIAASLAPVQPSAGVTHALDAARQRRFIALVPDDNIPPDEQAVRAALRALALYALGDSATAVGVQLRLAQPLAASAGPSQVLLGGLRALEGNDRDALASWTSAIASGIDAAALRPLLMDTYLRQGDHQRATELGAAALAATPDDPMLVRCVAATHLAAGRLPAALAVLERRLQAEPEDIDAQWLTLHALFTGFVEGDGPGAGAADIERFKTLARRYIEANGRHAALAQEWSSAIP
jgi:tetratricopeptide (TPR) repeat protein